jgi:hypothetical protein
MANAFLRAIGKAMPAVVSTIIATTATAIAISATTRIVAMGIAARSSSLP